MIKGRKTATEGFRKKKTFQKLLAYLNNQIKAQQDYCQTFKEYLQNHDLQSSFNQLHLYLNLNMIRQIKKDDVLPDGVYILLEGSVTYIWTKNRYDRNRKGHLFSLAKTGVYSNLSQSYPERASLLTNGYSILINTHFAVVQSQGNICTNQDCFFLQICPQILELTSFYALKAQKQNIFSKAKLPGYWIYQTQPLVSLNCTLHHTFKIKILHFRNRFQVNSLGVIKNGSALYKPKRSQGTIQFLKYSLLLPGFQYQVSSSKIQIIQVDKNQTIVFKKPLIISKFVEQLTTRSSIHQINNYKQQVKKYCRKIMNSISTHKSNSKSSISLIKQQKKKKKNYDIFSKQNQQYWIVSTEFSKQNLKNLRLIKNKIKITQQEGSKKTKRPRIIFNISKNKIRDQLNRTSAEQQRLPSFANASKNHIGSSSSKLMERYQNYAKDIYSQFIKSQASKRKDCV